MMAALSKQRGVELMRWRWGNGDELAYFAGGRVLRKRAGGGWKRFGTWEVAALASVREALAAGGWVKVRSMGERV